MDEFGERVAEHVGTRIRRIRRDQDLSQEALGFMADVHRTHISQIEGGSLMPRLDTVIKLAGGLDVPAATLLDGLVWDTGRHRPGRQVVTGKDARHA